MIVAKFRTFYQPGSMPQLTGANVVLSKLDSWKMPEEEDAFWHSQYRLEPYFVAGRSFDQYRPAYLLGSYAAVHQMVPQQRFEFLEDDLRMQWLQAQGSSLLSWEQARDAVVAAWKHKATTPTEVKSLSLAEQSQFTQLLESGHRFVDQANAYVEHADSSMQVDALRRFAHDATDLLAQRESLVRGAEAKTTDPVQAPHAGLLQALQQLWQRAVRAMDSSSLDQVLQYLRAWLESAEALAQQPLPSRVTKVLRHHVMVLRAQTSFYAGTRRMRLNG